MDSEWAIVPIVALAGVVAAAIGCFWTFFHCSVTGGSRPPRGPGGDDGRD